MAINQTDEIQALKKQMHSDLLLMMVVELYLLKVIWLLLIDLTLQIMELIVIMQKVEPFTLPVKMLM